MSMYNLVFGESSWPMQIMDLLFDVTPDDVGRYRDHWLERDGEDAVVLAIYTRNGGGNRPEYAEQIERMRAKPAFVSDADDTFDSTYATFRFRLTRQQMRERIAFVNQKYGGEGFDDNDDIFDELWGAAEHVPRNMGTVWQAMLGAMEGGVKTND